MEGRRGRRDEGGRREEGGEEWTVVTSKLETRSTKQLVSFYFTNFPYESNKADLWKLFQQHGEINDIFIAHKLNNKGQRFEFARFRVTGDYHALEQKLKQIWIGSFRLRVNVSKYKKNERRTMEIREAMNKRSAMGDKRKEMVQNHKGLSKRLKEGISYAEVIKKNNVKTVYKGKEKMQNQSELEASSSTWNGLEFNVQEEEMEWLKKCYVGQLINICDALYIQEKLSADGVFFLKTHSMGGNLILLQPIIEEEVNVMIRDVEDILYQWFTEIRTWTPGDMPKLRFAWLRCIGNPVHAWNETFFRTIVASLGTFITVDGPTANKNRLDIARILIQTSSSDIIDRRMRIKINGLFFDIRLLEENMDIPGLGGSIEMHKEYDGSSEDLASVNLSEEYSDYSTPEYADVVKVNINEQIWPNCLMHDDQFYTVGDTTCAQVMDKSTRHMQIDALTEMLRCAEAGKVSMEQKLTLPHELIVEILLRLPVRSLLRFKCVSKSWLSLISDPQFAKSHFDLAASPTHRLLCLSFTNYGYNIKSLDFEASLYDDSAVVHLNFPPPSQPGGATFREILVSCRGFILLAKKPSELIVWNPSTGVHRQIPDFDYERSYSPYGIGYDSSTDDYLVVFTDLRTRLEYFSLKTNAWSYTQCIDVQYLDIKYPSRAGLFFNGALHWLVYSNHTELYVIIAFDLMERSLSQIPLSLDLVTELRYTLHYLRVMGGHLSLCCMIDGDRRERTVIWVMKEYKVHSSWTKSFVRSTYDIPKKVFSPICFTKCGGIFGSNGWKTLVKLNNKGELLEHRTYMHERGLYRESLLSLPSYSEEASKNDQQ